MCVYIYCFKFQEGIWNDLEKQFEKLMERLSGDTPEISALCSEIDNTKGIWNTVKKEMCKALIKIKFFMSGIKGNKIVGGRAKVEHLGEVESYFRCIVGSMTMVNLYKRHCKLNEVAEYIVKPMEAAQGMWKELTEHEKCRTLPFSGMKIGKEFIGNKVNEWLEKRKSGTQMYTTIMGNTGCQGGQQGRNMQGVVQLLGRKDETELQDFNDDSKNLPEGKLEEVLTKMDEVNRKRKKPSDCLKESGGKYEEEEELRITEWFTAFSNNPTEDDAINWIEFEAARALCERSDNEYKYDADKYKGFCEVMVRNIMLVTNIENQYKAKQTKCKNTVKDIPLCDLLKVWMSYMDNFCAPRSVMKYAFEAVENIKGTFVGGSEYTECKYESFNNLYRDGEDMLPKLWETMKNSVLSNELGRVQKKKWCDESTRNYTKGLINNASHTRNDKSVDDGILNSNPELQKLKSTIVQIENKVKKEEEEDRKVLQDALQKAIQESKPQTPPPVSQQGDDCTKETVLCNRVDCVTKKWGVNNGQTVTWENMKVDINTEATKMFNKISTKSKGIPGYCSSTDQNSRRVTDSEKKACKYITSGLQYIYEVQEEDGDETRKKDNRHFKQIMLCLVLNAYADKLIQEVKSPCKAGEDTIEQAFEEGNKNINSRCKDGPDKCVKCERVKDFKNCNVGGTDVKEKLKTILNENNPQITQTLTTLNDINKNLCDRAQCKEIWEDEDMGNILQELSVAIIKGNGADSGICEKIEDGNSTPLGANKTACKYITTGLRHIYSIKVEGSDIDASKKNNQQFRQTMACLALNVFANEILKEKNCVNVDKIKKAFADGGSPYKELCNSDDNCEKCEWDDCTKFKIGTKNQRDRIKGELEKNKDITQALNAITNICQPDVKPAAAKPAATKPATTKPGTTDNSTSQSVPGRSEEPPVAPTASSIPVEPEPKKESNEDGTACNTSNSEFGVKISCGKASGPGLDDPVIPAGTRVTVEDPPGQPPAAKAGSGSQVPTETKEIDAKTKKVVPPSPVVDSAGDGPPAVPGGVPGGPAGTQSAEVLDECQKGDVHSKKEDFFEIMVQEFMGRESIKGQTVPEEDVPKEEDSKECVPKEQIPGLGKEEFVLEESVPVEDVPREQVPSSDSGFRM
ncbi:SICA antigen [Plasmodium coatneyi]|uniref:SICA antigen n=1 Tax=Plasmodium coatneyi TaxID=208452 RepID=A0A1B1DSM2_9APIC|nr:SICA antigen [Plasmodium coatneyi]ANQ05796.1 SICA antigen [Plasmodium coatneyi]